MRQAFASLNFFLSFFYFLKSFILFYFIIIL